MAKQFCASLILVAAYLLLLTTGSISSGDAQSICYFDGGYIGEVKVATSTISCPSCISGCLAQCGRSKFTVAHDQCDIKPEATLQCYCCCSNIQEP
ncbi:hypothetical protein MKX03_021863 [Papaver bracteatum]|nr:hypothetical protein MKX03_019081 [Papaver bracteatum]KAI3853309.1 hypothetical protein MKX03_021863 [Papaver bracteatum]